MIASLMGIEILNISVALHDWQRGEWSHLEWRIEAITALSLLHKSKTNVRYDRPEIGQNVGNMPPPVRNLMIARNCYPSGSKVRTGRM